MSLAFQSSDSIKQALFEELQNILSADKSTRIGGEENLKKLEFTEGELFLHFFYFCKYLFHEIGHFTNAPEFILLPNRLWSIFG